MASTPTLSLKNLLVSSKSTELDFPGFDGFKVKLSFLSKDTLINIRKKSTRSVYKNRVTSEELDEEMFLKLYVESAIKGWSGLKLKYVEQLAPIDLTGCNLEEEIPFSTEEALSLMKNSNVFDQWISDNVTDLGKFQTNKESK